MARKDWYVFTKGVSFGPLPTDVVQIMLEQKRLHNTEFIWRQGMARWERIRDLSEFGEEWQLPEYPDEPIPSLQGEESGAPAPRAVAEKPKTVSAQVALHEASPPKKRKAAKKTAVKKTAKLRPVPAPEPEIPVEADAAPVEAEEETDHSIRRSPRVIVSGTLSVAEVGTFKLVDMSETGVLIESNSSLNPGMNLVFDLTSPEISAEPLHMTGVVARNISINGRPHVGVEFTRVNPAYKRTLSDFVTQRAVNPKAVNE